MEEITQSFEEILKESNGFKAKTKHITNPFLDNLEIIKQGNITKVADLSKKHATITTDVSEFQVDNLVLAKEAFHEKIEYLQIVNSDLEYLEGFSKSELRLFILFVKYIKHNSDIINFYPQLACNIVGIKDTKVAYEFLNKLVERNVIARGLDSSTFFLIL